MTAGSPDVLVEHTDAVLRVTFNSPQTLNALTRSMLTSAADAVEAAAADPTVRVITLTGAGRAFSAGANLLAAEADDATGTTTIDEANRLTQALCAAPKPVVAAVNEAHRHFGRLDVVVNNAAVFRDTALDRSTAGEVLELITANLALAVTGCHTAVNHFIASRRAGRS